MPTPTKGPRLGGSPAHERLMLANLATSLFEHGRITTTEAKAKRLRPLAEKLVTFAKRGDLHARRQVMTTIRDKDVVHTLFAEIGPRYENRPGGYTRITKVGPRKGDNAPMAVIELVEALTVGQQAVGEAERARGTRFAPRRGACRGRRGHRRRRRAADDRRSDRTGGDTGRRGSTDRTTRRRRRSSTTSSCPTASARTTATSTPEPIAENAAVVDDPELSPEVAAAAAAEVEAAELGDAATAGDARARRRVRARPEVTDPTRIQHAPRRARHRYRWRARPSPVSTSPTTARRCTAGPASPAQRTVQGDLETALADGAAQPGAS